MTTHIGDYMGGNSLKAEDLLERDVALTISGHEVKQFKENERPKIILKFNGTDKTLVCNATNLKRISQTLGSEIVEEWAGKSITLGWEWVSFAGDTVQAVRVMMPGMSSPRAAAAPPAAAPAVPSTPMGPGPVDQHGQEIPEEDIPF